MNEDKLTEKELLEELENMYHWSRSGFLEDKIGLNGLKQAYAQLKEIVEEHFKYEYLWNDPECRSVDEILEEKAKQQKPTVTNAEITELSARLRDTSRQTLYETKLKRWLESKGFTVED